MAIRNSKFGINGAHEFQSGFGPLVNGAYVMPAQFQFDLDYLYDVCEFRKWRNAIQATNGFAPIIDLQDRAAALAKAKGFEVSYGLVPASATRPGDWPSVWAAQQTHALAIQAAGSTDIYCIANEMESGNYVSSRTEEVLSVTRSSNVVTVVTTRPWLMTTGKRFVWFTASNTIAGSPVIGINPNSSFLVSSVVNSTTFTFASVGADGSQTGGVWLQLSTTSIIAMIKAQATALKAAGITMPLSNSCLQGNASAVAGSYWISSWISEGRGDVDWCDLNVYGSNAVGSTNTFEGYLQDFKDEIQQGFNAFGVDHFRVTEWSANAQTSISQTKTDEFTHYQMKRAEFLDYLGVDSHVFCYRQNAEGARFAATNPYDSTITQTFRDWWWPFTNQRQWSIETTFGTPIQVSKLRAQALSYTARFDELEFNYGQDLQTGGAYPTTTVRNDFANMIALGRTKVRIGFGNITFTAGVDNVKLAILEAKSQGLYVIAVCANGDPLTDANFSTYEGQVNTIADWCWANGVDEFSPGNEIEYYETTSHTLTSSVVKIKAMGTDILASHFPADGVTRFLSYSGVAQSSMDYVGAPGGWIATGKGPFHLLGYNIYGDSGNFAQFCSRITDFHNTFGNGMYISEWNISGQSVDFPASESDQGRLIKQKLDFLITIGRPAFFFTYRSDIATGTTAFALYVGAVARIWFNYLFEPVLLEREFMPIPRLTAGGLRELVG